MSAPFDLSSSTGYLVNRLAASMKTALEQALVPFDVTSQQWAAMAAVHAAGVISVLTLAERLGVDPGATSRLLQRMEEKGLLARQRSPGDSRAREITLTPRGKGLLPKMSGHAKQVLAEFHAPLTAGEIAELNRLLAKILEARET